MATRYEILGRKFRGADTVVTLQALDTSDDEVLAKPAILSVGTILRDPLGTRFRVRFVEGDWLVIRGKYRPSGDYFYPEPTSA